MFFYPISTKDKSRLHHPGKISGYALNPGGGWTGDSIIADWRDVENCVASELHERALLMIYGTLINTESSPKIVADLRESDPKPTTTQRLFMIEQRVTP